MKNLQNQITGLGYCCKSQTFVQEMFVWFRAKAKQKPTTSKSPQATNYKIHQQVQVRKEASNKVQRPASKFKKSAQQKYKHYTAPVQKQKGQQATRTVHRQPQNTQKSFFPIKVKLSKDYS